MSKIVFTVIGLVLGIIGLGIIGVFMFLVLIALSTMPSSTFTTILVAGIIGGMLALIFSIVFLALSPYTEEREK